MSLNRQSNSKLWRDVLDSLNDAVMALSADGEIVLKNPAAEAILGGGQVNRGLVRALFGRNQWLEGMVRDCLERRQESSCADATLALPGHDLAVRAEVAPLLNESGQFKGAVVLLHDLSHQKGAELVAGSGDSGERLLGLSPSGLAHEIKNPLTGIKGAAELLAELFPEQRDALIAEARDIGWHRVQIARHYPTDIYAGRVLAQAIVRKLNACAAFRQDLAAARAEITAAKETTAR